MNVRGTKAISSPYDQVLYPVRTGLRFLSSVSEWFWRISDRCRCQLGFGLVARFLGVAETQSMSQTWVYVNAKFQFNNSAISHPVLDAEEREMWLFCLFCPRKRVQKTKCHPFWFTSNRLFITSARGHSVFLSNH